MVKIQFENNVTKANADTFNTMQDNIESAINDATITLDNAVSTSSTNGVENQAITNYVDNKILDTYSTSSTSTYSCDYINNNSGGSDVYSTTETLTNKIWIDNRPIYRKIIQATSPSSTNSWVKISEISNLDTIIDLHGWLLASNGRTLPIQFSEPSAEIATTLVGADIEMKIILSNWQNASCYMVAEYTKTTD